MAYQTITFHKLGPVGKITLNRPERLNVINTVMGSEIKQLLGELSSDDGIKVLVIAGNPRVRQKEGRTEVTNCFSAGWDLSEAGPVESVPEMIASFEKPVIAMVNGIALGGGCVIALASDFIFISDISQIGLPEINRGFLPAWGATQILPRKIGISRAKKMIFTGEAVGASEAREIGLVDFVVPAEQLEDAVIAFAQKLASKAPLALREIKRAIDRGCGTDLETGMQYEREAFGFLVGTEDFQEGIAAFIEKREPLWKGK